jgi:ribonuclease VapC
MPDIILDASALLALLNAEPGADIVAEALTGAAISSVNISEVVAKLNESGMPEKIVRQVLESLELQIIPFDEEQAYRAGLLRTATKGAGFSLGDRACLCLGLTLGLEILTADRTWAKISNGARIKVIR